MKPKTESTKSIKTTVEFIEYLLFQNSKYNKQNELPHDKSQTKSNIIFKGKGLENSTRTSLQNSCPTHAIKEHYG